MKIYVKLFAALTQRVSGPICRAYPQGIPAGHPLEIELSEKSTIESLVAHLGLPKKELKLLFVNGKARGLDYILAPGDQVGIFPPVGGG